MAATSPVAPNALKRGPGRPPKLAAQPPLKRQKRASLLVNETPAPDSPGQEEVSQAQSDERALPSKLSKHEKLPTLPQIQSLSLPDEEYASIASSGVLAASLEKSKASWTSEGVFERYWVKPETGKNAKPPPLGNPDLKSMKSRGLCRLRIEPHIFEVEIWVVDKPRLPAQPKQHIQKQQTWQSQTVPFYLKSSTGQVPPNQSSVLKSAAQVSTAEDKKSAMDPVIAMLAQRAGSDPALKALMREVAAGNASQDQLKIFQQHIDELSILIKAQKEGQNAAPSPPEVVFSFTNAGASPDRFLFPQHCILEALTPQHLLASFIITKTIHEPRGDVSYWMPVTLMIEVAYGREGILKDIRAWVKPAEQSREYMREAMKQNTRVPSRHLALRLPLKSAAGRDSRPSSHASTPVPVAIEDKRRKSIKSALPQKTAMVAPAKIDRRRSKVVFDDPPGKGTGQVESHDAAIKTEAPEKAAEEASNEAGARRSGRATRRSLRGVDE